MPERRNYQKELEKKTEEIRQKEEAPRLLLHVCCAPCASYCLEYLSEYFDITAFYYNPNISPKSEHDMRAAELKRLVREMPFKHGVQVSEGPYEPELFYGFAEGLKNEPEGGARCEKCFELRLKKTAELAKKEKFDYFATTLTVSPLKSAEKLNNIGEKLAEEYGVAYLASDFKKRGGFQRSTELSKQYGLYRQDYCGCVFGKKER